MEQIIDSKYAYWEKIHSDIKTFLWHDTKQIMVMGILYMILMFFGSIYYSLAFYLIWKLSLESFYGYCDDKQPAYVMIPFCAGILISVAIVIPIILFKTKTSIFRYAVVMIILALASIGLLFYFTKQIQCDIFAPLEFMTILSFFQMIMLTLLFRRDYKKGYYKDYGPTLK